MLNKSWLLSLSILCALGLVFSGTRAADSSVDTGKLPPVSDKKGLTFEKDIKPILDKSCLKCHSGDKPKGKYRVDTAASLVKGGSSGDVAVVMGKSEKSPIVHYVADLVVDMEMPPLDKRDTYPALTKEQIGLVRAWIDQGAK